MYYCFIAFVLLSSSITINSHIFDDEYEFSYDVKSPNGPSHWSEINPDWSLCNKGKRQSPIDLINEKAVAVYDLRKSRTVYKAENSVLDNNGHSVELRWEGDAGYIEINGTQYDLKQCHWHSPSEHTINGKRFDLEVHLVHKSKKNKIAVVGSLYEIGQPDSFLSKLSEHIKTIKDTKGKESNVGVVDPIQLEIFTSQYYRYMGSLTTPPCTEEVVWTVFRKVQTVSKEQVQLLRDAILDKYVNNARPIQPLNSRDLQLYMLKKEDRAA